MRHDTGNNEPCLAPLVLDSSGGAALHGPCGNRDEGRRLVLNELRLRALDLHNDPALEVLDLRGCGRQSYLHLQLDRLPCLREIYLPRLVEGAILHLFNLDVPASLTVHGRVREIDADWQNGTLRLTHRQRSWDGVRLLGHDAGPDDLLDASLALPLNVALSAELLQAVVPDGELRLSAPGEWYLADASPLKRLVIDGPGSLRVSRAHGLDKVQMLTPAYFEGDQLDALTWLGAGEARHSHSAHEVTQHGLAFTGSAVLRGNMSSLALLEAWGDIQLYTPCLEHLTLSSATSLTLHRCGRLETVSLPDGLLIDCHGTVPTPLLHVARFFIDEATLKQALKRLEAGEHALLDSVLTMLPQRAGAASAFHGLTSLLQLAELGLDAQALWHCRCQIAAWQMMPRRRRQRTQLTDQDLARADAAWRWELPRDRLDEGIMADLQLWAICSPRSDNARAYRKTLLASCNEGQKFEWIMRFGSRPDAPGALRQLMLEALVNRQGNDSLLGWLSGYGSQLSHRYLVRIFTQEPLTAEQRHALLGAISEVAPWEELPQLIGTLLPRHAGPVRAFLMALSRQPDHWFERRLPGRTNEARIRQARLQLTQLALMPVGAAASSSHSRHPDSHVVPECVQRGPSGDDEANERLDTYLEPPTHIRRCVETDT
jgi:hypothetical protein